MIIAKHDRFGQRHEQINARRRSAGNIGTNTIQMEKRGDQGRDRDFERAFQDGRLHFRHPLPDGG